MANNVESSSFKISLGDDFQPSSGPISLSDACLMILDYFEETSLGKFVGKMKLGDQFLSIMSKMKSGDIKTIAIVGATILIGTMLILSLFGDQNDSSSKNQENDSKKGMTKEEEKEEPRDFTIAQLRDFDGTDGKRIYIGMKGDVFDVSSARQFYGEGSGYHCFAGRDATRAMAKLSFEEEDLSNPSVDDINPFEREILNDWYSKFKDYKCYPIVGRVSHPGASRTFTKSELLATKDLTVVPEGRVDAPMYMGICGKVIDVSYGGKEMYGKGSPYNAFIGIDASRALAKMSFKPEDLGSSDLSDLTPTEQKTLADWEKKFIDARKYPVVGTLTD